VLQTQGEHLESKLRMDTGTDRTFQAEFSFGPQYFAAILRFLSRFARLPSNHKGKQLKLQAHIDVTFYPGFELGLCACHLGFTYFRQGRLRIYGPYRNCEHFSCAGNGTGLLMPLR
jgi:hypothetical protein